MTITAQTSFAGVTNGRPASRIAIHTEGIAKLNAQAVFQARPTAVTQHILSHMERRDRMVLILQDGKRSIQDVTRLIHRSEVEVAQILVRLLKYGYIDYMGTRGV